jgi:hypothetical protein
MTDLTLFHTAEVHVATFDKLAPKAQLNHMVRPDWLARAQVGIDDALEQEIAAAIAAAPAATLCTCTTLGEVAERHGATRIDWPMMQQAARIGGPVLMVYCLDSTAAPSKALLERAFAESGQNGEIRCLPLTVLWRHFTDGNTAQFHSQIGAWICSALASAADTACVVLAQASMAGAADLLKDKTDVPILSSPQIAVQTLLPQGLYPPSAKNA